MALGQLTNQIVLMFVLMLVGVLINKLGFMQAQTSNDLTNILLYIVSPCLIIGAFEQHYSASRMQQLMLVCVGIFIFYIIEIFISSIVKLSATLMAYSYNWSRKLNQLWHNIRWTTIA
ncbi:hypothetical protein C5L34_000581 [Lentilactobacillus hilgardii]|nr:hypothetical protein C5L34_000581 [Lentilactobacillus hilgardii]